MKIPMFIALLVLVGTAFAQDDRTPTHEAATMIALQMMAAADAKYHDGAYLYFAKAYGISKEGSDALTNHYRDINAESQAQQAAEQQQLCSKRAELSTAAAFDAEVAKLRTARQAQTKDAVLRAYTRVSAKDAAALRAAVSKIKEGAVGLGTEDPPKRSDADTAAFLASLCGGAS